MTFDKITADGQIKEIIKSAFDTSLDVGGEWGYDISEATTILSSDQPLMQLEHLLASMRTYIEMSMTKERDERYGGINLNEFSREEIVQNENRYHKIGYKVTAMKEETYSQFIDEYKEKYGKPDFDLSDYFERRKKATLYREIEYWFKVD
ncbi:hypothetical protein MNB_SV-6-198 [hydrothermal vent metagenome]|uniref:Uncharacterized protein n=1 Tax=hydrothermal vent metagenome TaxID=652676 RepID=A0A1W1BGR0_9ZZZZ